MGDMKSELKRVGLVPKRKPPNKRTERLSERDLKELMGMNKQTLKRGAGGAWKQK